MKVKICGVTRYEDARQALDLGAWAIGLNFYAPSPRYISPERAKELVARLPREALVFGVFVDAPVAEVNAIVAGVGLGGAQLHGAETPAMARGVKAREVMKALRVGEGFDPAIVDEYRGFRILLDALVPGAKGGTGRTFDWKLARKAGERTPIILAGGLDPENAAEAIRVARPDGIDIASGVESRPGEKDLKKMRRLFEEVANMKKHPSVDPGSMK